MPRRPNRKPKLKAMRDADFDKDIRPDFAIDGYKLVCTCSACPEQYDVFNDNNKLVGYLRLRHGQFRADCPDVGGTTVYSSRPSGDGMFEPEERMPELIKAVAAIKEYWQQLLLDADK